VTDEPIDPTRRRAWETLVDVYQSVLPDVVGALEDGAGIDSGVFSVLGWLGRAEPPGRMRFSTLHRHLRTRYTQPGLSRLVQRMEAHGLVERRPDPSDGRGVQVVCTRTGRTQHRRAEQVYHAALRDRLGSAITEDEARALTDVLARVATRLHAADATEDRLVD
jgi:DNA-binding MarR family transcriptional regulator